MKTLKLSLFAFTSSLLYFVFVAPSCTDVSKSIPQNPNAKKTTGIPEQNIKSISEENGYTCDFDHNSAESLLNLKFNNGDVYVCHKGEEKIDSIKLSTGASVQCSYTSDGNISECATDYGGYKVIQRCSYSNGYISELEGLTGIKQSDGSFKEETTYKCSEFVVDETGIQSCVYETYIGGSLSQKLDVNVACYSTDNSLYQSATHCSLIEFSDYFNNLFYYSPRCIQSITATDQSNSYNINYGCSFNSDGQLTEIDIDHPSIKTKRTYSYN